MFSKVFAAAALAVVSAADVPVFSSNDDYDEINLNIRMLSGNGTTPAVTHEVPVELNMTVTYDGNPAQDVPFKTACDKSIKSAAGAISILSTYSATAGRRLSEGRRLAATPWDLTVNSKLGYADSTAADNAKTKVAVGSFATEFASALNNEMTTVLGLTTWVNVDASNIAKSAGDVVACAPTCASAGTSGAAAASPSPSPSSNAAKVAVSTLAAFAAFMASMF